MPAGLATEAFQAMAQAISDFAGRRRKRQEREPDLALFS